VLSDPFARRIARTCPTCAVVTDPELLAYLTGFCTPAEEWPVANPFTPVPALLVVGPEDATLVVASMYRRFCDPDGPSVLEYRSYDPDRAPAPTAELAAALGEALTRCHVPPGGLAVDHTLPHVLAPTLAAHGLEPAVSPITPELDAELAASVGRAARLADVAQAAVLRLAEPGRTELELASAAHAAMSSVAGARVSAILTVTAGRASGARPGPATTRVVADGDLVLCDVAPWGGGAWADAATTVCAGRPSRRQQRMFDAVRDALELANALCRPGAVGGDVDAAVRASLSGSGDPYPHHTGHGLGVRWWQEPAITRYSRDRIDEGAIVAVEPALYDAEVGGVRLEHTLRVRAGGNELLTRHQHRLTP
jgi:Xaa-Pro aminopeptidase